MRNNHDSPHDTDTGERQTQQLSARFWRIVPRTNAVCSYCGYSLEGLAHSHCPECNRNIGVYLLCVNSVCSSVQWSIFGIASGIGCYGTLSVLLLVGKSRTHDDVVVAAILGLWAVVSVVALLLVIHWRHRICESSRLARWVICTAALAIQAGAIGLPWCFGLRA